MALWQYGTSCPFSLSRVLRLPSRPANCRRPGPSRRRLRPSVRSFLRPALGRARRYAFPRPLRLLPPSPRPNAQRPSGCGAGPGEGAGSEPSLAPSSAPAVLSRLATPHLFLVSILSFCCVSCCPLTVGCPSCPTNSHSVIIAK